MHSHKDITIPMNLDFQQELDFPKIPQGLFIITTRCKLTPV